ncbi:hypothetical protein ACLOJK_039920 [Asimina triloba]
MAFVEAVVSFFVERLGDQLIREVSLLRHERNQIEWVRRLFRILTLHEMKRMRGKNRRQEVRDAANHPEDIIDVFFPNSTPEVARISGHHQEKRAKGMGKCTQEHKLAIRGRPSPNILDTVLSLSYKDLPYDLKPCFVYLGTFPEDHVFPAKKLVRLGAAEGFLHPRGEEMEEEVGEDCRKELIQRSLVQVARRSATGAIKS